MNMNKPITRRSPVAVTDLEFQRDTKDLCDTFGIACSESAKKGNKKSMGGWAGR